jgi:hypothetical protein
VVLDEGAVEASVAAIGHAAGADIREGWCIERLHAQASGGRVKTEDAEAIARHDGWVYVFGSQFGKKDGPLQPKRSFVARFREAEVRHVPGRRRGRGRGRQAHPPDLYRGGMTLAARARSRGISTSSPRRLRTAKPRSSAASRGPTTSATSSPPPGAGRRQRTTTRWPTSCGPMRTTYR